MVRRTGVAARDRRRRPRRRPSPRSMTRSAAPSSSRSVATARSGMPPAPSPGPGCRWRSSRRGTGNVLAAALRVRGMERALATIRSGSRARSTSAWRAGGPGAARPCTSGTSSSPAGWASMPGSWPRPSTSGSAGSGSAPTSARPCGRPSRLAPGPVPDPADGVGDRHHRPRRPRRQLRRPDPGQARCPPAARSRGRPARPHRRRWRGRCSTVCGAPRALLWHVGEQDGTVIRRGVRDVRIVAEPAQPIETDGDPHPPGWLEASVLPGALTVLASR